MSKSDRFKRLAENRDAESSNPQKHQVIDKIVGDFEKESLQENANTVHDQTSVSIVSHNDNEDTHKTLNSTIETKQQHDSLLLNSNTEHKNISERGRRSVKTKIPKPIEEFEKRLKKPTIEETHTRGTFLIRNDLLKRLDRLARNQQRGFKTHLVNYALELVLDEIETR